MRGRTVLWVAVFGVLLLALGGTVLPGWVSAVVATAALVLVIPSAYSVIGASGISPVRSGAR
jgi:hypothetical protein